MPALPCFTMRWDLRRGFLRRRRALADLVHAAPAERAGAPCLGRRRAPRSVRRPPALGRGDRRVRRPGGSAGAICAFCAQARRIFDTLDGPFIRADRPSLLGLIGAVGPRRMGQLVRIQPFETLWGALGRPFPRPAPAAAVRPLRHLCRLLALPGAGDADAGGACRAGGRMAGRGRHAPAGRGHGEPGGRRGAESATGPRSPRSWSSAAGRRGVRLAAGERIAAEAVVVNGDAAAVASGRLGPSVAGAVPRTGPASRSLSAVTWLLHAETDGFPLHHHNVFFSGDYRGEFDDIFRAGRLPPDAHGLCLRPGPRRPDPGSARAASGCSASSTRRRPATPAPAAHGDRAMRRADIRPPGAAAACSLHREPDADAGDDAHGFRRAVPGDRGSAVRQGARTAGRRRSAGRGRARGCRACIWRGAACIRGRACRWRRCRAGWRRRRCWRTALRPAGPAGRLCLVVRRRAERRRPARADHHRLHRQRVLALLRLGRGGAEPAEPLRAQRRALRRVRGTAGP